MWSAYRASAYGSGLLTIYNETTARWHWNGFFRNNVNPTGYFTDGTTPEVRPWCCRQHDDNDEQTRSRPAPEPVPKPQPMDCISYSPSCASDLNVDIGPNDDAAVNSERKLSAMPNAHFSCSWLRRPLWQRRFT